MSRTTARTIEPQQQVDDEQTMNRTEKPHSCRLIGLECRDCVAGSALQLALVCGRIPSQDVERIFFAMYDDQACHAMSNEFCGVYRATVRESTGSAASEPAVWINSNEPVPAF